MALVQPMPNYAAVDFADVLLADAKIGRYFLLGKHAFQFANFADVYFRQFCGTAPFSPIARPVSKGVGLVLDGGLPRQMPFGAASTSSVLAWLEPVAALVTLDGFAFISTSNGLGQTIWL